MEFIFHEKQSGSLCAQHCLNALLQGPYFTVFDLAEIARSLDESERRHMAEAGFDTSEYREFLRQPSSNYDDSGFFSIQVLVNALEVWNLELLPFTSSEEFCKEARENPTQKDAFICNFREHWLTIRKIGHQWFNLNSLLNAPELISDTYLTLFLKQLQMEGYSIFVLRGALPPCEADEILRLCPVEPKSQQIHHQQQLQQHPDQNSSSNAAPNNLDDDPELRWALESSRMMYDDDDDTLRQALEISAIDSSLDAGRDQQSMERNERLSDPQLSLEEMRQRRLEHLEKRNSEN